VHNVCDKPGKYEAKEISVGTSANAPHNLALKLQCNARDVKCGYCSKSCEIETATAKTRFKVHLYA